MGLTGDNDQSRTLVALPEAADRKNLRKIVQEAGFGHCREVADLVNLEERLGGQDVDLLITTLNDRGWDSTALIRRNRLGLLGNPFMLIMVLIDQPNPAIVNRVVDAGADDLLLPPWLDRLVTARLDLMLHGRKAFIVTHDYVGPERRVQTREGSASPVPVEVPNPLELMAFNITSREEMKILTERAREEINLHKIKTCGNQLRFLADRVVANYAAQGHGAILSDVQVMMAASNELMTRAVNTHFAPAIELTESLGRLCQRLVREDRQPRPDEIAILPSLADAVIISIYNNEPEPLPAVLLR